MPRWRAPLSQGAKIYTIERSAFGSAQMAALKRAIEEDGFYTLRVSKDGASAQTSVRAACLASPGALEEFRVAVDGEERPVGLSYKLASGSCGKGPAAALPTGAWQAPASSLIRVAAAKQAPVVAVFGDDINSGSLPAGR